MKNTYISIMALTLCALCSIAPLILLPEFISGGWDLAVHVSNAYQVSASIKEGILYPRWLPDSNGGYGSPTTIFYSPLYYLITGAVNLFIPSLIVSLKVTTFAGFLLSGVSMYIFLRNFCGHIGSVAGGIVYQLLPYHILDFYIRESLAETFAFFWFPLIIHFSYKGATKNRLHYWIGLSFSYAGLILTHIATAYIFTFVIAAAALFYSVKEKSLRMLLNFILASILGLSLSAVYFIPMFFERRFVHAEWLIEGPWGVFSQNFLGSENPNINTMFRFQLKLIAILYVLLAVLSFTLKYLKRKWLADMYDASHLYFLLFVTAFSFFITTSLSMPIWEFVPGLPTVIFPWRWLIITTFSVSAMIGFTFNNFSLADIKKDRFIMAITAAFHAVIIINLSLSSAFILAAEPMQRGIKDMIRKGNLIEYRPIWLTDKRKDFSRETGKPTIVFKEGDGTVDIASWKSNSRLLKVNASIPSTLRVSTFYYPGWTGLINGKEIPIGIEKDSGAMLLSLPAGKNTVLLEFRDTPLRMVAKWISILSLFFALASLIVARLKRL